MKREIERKFLIKTNLLPNISNNRSFKIKQGYLSLEPVVRIRLIQSSQFIDFSNEDNWAFASGYLTIKGPGLVNHSEFETLVQFKDAKEMYDTLANKGKISKTRFIIPDLNDRNIKWELDIFKGENQGLVIAEIELPEENYEFDIPEWIGQEITNDPKYSNVNLAINPFGTW